MNSAASPLVDKMKHIRAMQAAMRGKQIYKEGKSEFIGGGKWEIVTQFKGKSHEDGGIDLEVADGYVRRISGGDDADDIAKKGRFWRNLGAAAYGLGEGLLDTVTFGLTDPLTDYGYKKLQDIGGSTEQERREQNSIRGYTTAAGAIGGGFLTGGATTGSAIAQTGKGLGAGIAEGSPDSQLAQQIGLGLTVGGAIGGLIVGNQGYGSATPGMAKAGLSMTGKSSKGVNALRTLAKYGKYAGQAFSVANAALSQSNALMGGGGVSPVQKSADMSNMLMGMGMTSSAAEKASEINPFGFGGKLGGKDGGGSSSGGGATDGDVFYAQVPMREETLAQLAKYNINV